MKKIMIAFLLLAGFSSKAQTLNNPNFENWTTGTSYADTLPTNWWSMYCNTVKQTTDAYQGMYATTIQGWFACGIAPGIMVNGQAPGTYGSFMESGTPFTSKPATLSGYYKYTDVTVGDSAEVTVILKRYNASTMQRDTVAYSSKALAATVAYTLFTVNINDLMPGVSPDSIIIMFNSSKYSLFDGTTMALPMLYIDRINMPETPMNIANNGNSLIESSIYPNPFSENATLEIPGDISKYEQPSIQIFDLTGKKVMDLGKITSNKVLINQGNLAKGTYFYQVNSSDKLISHGKFVIE